MVDKKHTEEEINQAMKEAEASLAMEGLKVDDEDDELIRKHLRGEITHQEFIKQVLKRFRHGK